MWTSREVKEASACDFHLVGFLVKLLHVPSKMHFSCRHIIILPEEMKKSFCVLFILHLPHTKAPVCQWEAKNLTLLSKKREKSDALIRSLSQPCRLPHPATPTGVLTVCKRWEAGREPKGGKLTGSDIGCILHLVLLHTQRLLQSF